MLNKTLLLLLFTFASALLLCAQDGPAVDIADVHCMYEITASSLKTIDFRNFTYRSYCGTSFGGGRRFELKDGKLTWKMNDDTGDSGEVEFTEVDFITTPDPERSRAIVFFTAQTCGGSCSQRSFVQVFSLSNGHPTVVQEFSFDSQASGTGNWFDPVKRTLRIIARSNDNTPHCCPEHVDEALFALEHGKFVLKSWKQLPLK